MKYLLFEDFSGHAVPVLFPNRVRHEEMREVVPYSRLIAAGYVGMGPKGIRCYGESRELQAAARPEDASIIMEHFTE